MDHQPVEYKGYTILPIAIPEGEDLYFGGYEISKDGKVVRVRKKTMPGFFYRDAALTDSIEHAKLEIENLVAMQEHDD
ncbi:hypothetical protein EDC30_1219 [Paucimonas lemoignei]|uniref:Uncharacterized protein n=1 Tax=Paucimonas lemoignei TaxID=29443 RepID=A0A4R3HTS9_PAULE|nr:hypothetical protein [Paucimonas lemoignei]TCS32585.1 hypothetical protein EDC30_1219 [Paucimonas lemoignei]